MIFYKSNRHCKNNANDENISVKKLIPDSKFYLNKKTLLKMLT